MSPQKHRILRWTVVAIFLICFFWRANGQPIADEVVFFKPLFVWLEKGPQRYGVWHTPFYPWINYLLVKSFGYAPVLMRLLGAICVLGATALIDSAVCFLAHKQGRALREADRSLIWVLTLLSPMALGSALIVDHDNTLLLLATAWFFSLLIRQEKRVWMLALAGAACLVGKDNTPLIYPLGIWISTGSLLTASLSGFFGALLFCGFTWIWDAHYGIPFLSTFEMTLLGTRTAGTLGGAQAHMEFARGLWVRFSPVFWVGPSLVAAVILKWRSLLGISRGFRAMLWVMAGVIFVYSFLFLQLTYHFPKYMSPFLIWWPAMAVLAWRPQFPGAWILGFVFFGWTAPDPMWVLYDRSPLGLVKVLPYYLVPLLAWAVVRLFKRKLTPHLATVLILSQLSLGFTYLRTLLFTDYSVTYWYGERVVSEVARLIPPSSGPRLLISSAEDIAFALRPMGGVFISVDDLKLKTAEICAGAQPIILVTRIREASSLLRSSQLKGLSECLTLKTVGADLVVGSKPAI